MNYYVAFHQNLLSLPNYLFAVIQYEKELMTLYLKHCLLLFESCLEQKINKLLQLLVTVNSKDFWRTKFSRIALKDIFFHVKNSRLGYYLPKSENDSVIL